MQGFIFDLDGTLADTMPVHYGAWLEILGRHGLVLAEERFYGLGGIPTRKIAEMLVRESGLAIDPAVVAREKEAAFVRAIDQPGAIRPITPVVDIARKRREEGAVAIASGGVRHLVERTMRAIEVFEWFPVIVTAEDTVRHKPEPDVFLEAARRMGVSPADCTVYEDTDFGLEAAGRAGMQGVDVRTIYTPRRTSTR
jgi:HAD superfamily hydrolase (TIGR01509 family)